MIRGAVLGAPISHSLSPVLHRSAYKFLDIEGDYSAIEVGPRELAQFIAQNSNEFDYLSLTMPLKEEVLALDVVIDENVQKILSGNTLIKVGSHWNLNSTDGSGFLQALSNTGVTKMDSVLILGAGGTARAVTGALDSVAKNIHILGRSHIREEALRSIVTESNFLYRSWTQDIDFSNYDLVVNTTPAGAADILTGAVSPKISNLFFDVIYKPWPTELAQRWADSGGTVINGLELLLYQGVDQLELVLGRKLDRSMLVPHLRSVLVQACQ
jgi:shikimate dehydrogenase